MTKTKISITFLALLLLFSPCYAQDVNLSTMTPDQVQSYIQELQTKANTIPQSQVITIRTDPELNQKLDLIESELTDMKTSFNQMQDRFNRLATDTGEAIKRGNVGVVTDVETNTKTQLTDVTNYLEDYIDQKTNPVRQNAPAVGAFLILAGCFLLWASRQYKLTQGAKNND